MVLSLTDYNYIYLFLPVYISKSHVRVKYSSLLCQLVHEGKENFIRLSRAVWNKSVWKIAKNREIHFWVGIRKTCDHLMIILQSSYDHLMIILWLSHNHLMILWISSKHLMIIFKTPYDHLTIKNMMELPSLQKQNWDILKIHTKNLRSLVNPTPIYFRKTNLD